jgi:hypothetical protein
MKNDNYVNSLIIKDCYVSQVLIHFIINSLSEKKIQFIWK